jgi:hypothetical protein
MRRTYRMLATLALGLGLAGGTTAAAAVATQPDQAAQRKAMYESELRQNLNLRDQRTREPQPATATTDLELSDAMRHSIARVPDPYVPPAVAAAPDVPAGSAAVLPSLLLGLVGGLVGGTVAAICWTASTRRRLPRTAAGA